MRMRTAVVVIIASLSSVPIVAPASAVAFELGVHEAIVREALGDGQTMSDDSLNLVIGSFWLGSGNLGNDVHLASPERHFDNATDPKAICTLWNAGLRQFMDEAVLHSVPVGDEKRELFDREIALTRFGEATHAIADFYSHTNWVELAVQARQWPQEAPLLEDSCDPSAFPTALQSGYFSLRRGAFDGCPDKGAPAPYQFCHAEVAKDHPDSGHGAGWAVLDRTLTTWHELAKDLAIQTTRRAWEKLHDRVIAMAAKDRAADPECAFMKLAWGGDRTCRRDWRITSLRFHMGLEGRAFLDHVTGSGSEIPLHWSSPRYRGPQSPPVFAEVRLGRSGMQAVSLEEKHTLDCGTIYSLSAGSLDVGDWRSPIHGRYPVQPVESDQFELTLDADVIASFAAGARLDDRWSPDKACNGAPTRPETLDLPRYSGIPAKGSACSMRLTLRPGHIKMPLCAATIVAPSYDLVWIEFEGDLVPDRGN